MKASGGCQLTGHITVKVGREFERDSRWEWFVVHRNHQGGKRRNRDWKVGSVNTPSHLGLSFWHHTERCQQGITGGDRKRHVVEIEHHAGIHLHLRAEDHITEKFWDDQKATAETANAVPVIDEFTIDDATIPSMGSLDVVDSSEWHRGTGNSTDFSENVSLYQLG
ncbi:hypothetical protein BJ508DRAFT_316078 [Ascobolus immersus RN42]|uniref:Uncharacterized protein n=1 Tax=Ascobolus immersus RN42 TaxID=1160509 RepID=A0A3N4H7Y6_ASCIM|nr:hypothetical protein BJ508DRAFT_316078 [Ascobolus immersus RN42]